MACRTYRRAACCSCIRKALTVPQLHRYSRRIRCGSKSTAVAISAQGASREMGEFEWRRSNCPAHREPDEVVWISVAMLDTAWSTTDSCTGKNGVGGGDRYARIGHAPAVPVPVLYMSVACLDADGSPGFTDGWHRFSWLRDHAQTTLPVEVPGSQGEAFASLFGTDSDTQVDDGT